MLVGINASPDDIRKAAVADARRALEPTAHFTRRGCPPTPDHDANYACRTGRVKAEQRLLIQWARENGKLGASGRLPPVFARGGEHEVFFQKRTQRYLKATRLDRQKGYGIALGVSQCEIFRRRSMLAKLTLWGRPRVSVKKTICSSAYIPGGRAQTLRFTGVRR